MAKKASHVLDPVQGTKIAGRVQTQCKLTLHLTMTVMKIKRNLKFLHWKLCYPATQMKLILVLGKNLNHFYCCHTWPTFLFVLRSKTGTNRSSHAYVVSAGDEKGENSNGSSDRSDDSKTTKGDSNEGEKNTTSSNGGRVTRSSQRAAATAATSTPTSGHNSANQSPTSSPTQNASNQTPSPGKH